MIEHPVPQNITSYQFHLIGNMTIKQFLLLLAGIVIAFLFYSSNLPTFIAWFFIFISVTTGVAMAFLPYEERSLDEWLVNFIRAIYRPTKYYWQRTARVPHYFSYQPRADAASQQPTLDLSPYRRRQVSTYLSSLPTAAATATNDPLDLFNDNSNRVLDLFSSVPAADISVTIASTPVPPASPATGTAPVPAPAPLLTLASLPLNEAVNDTPTFFTIEPEAPTATTAPNPSTAAPSHATAQTIDINPVALSTNTPVATPNTSTATLTQSTNVDHDPSTYVTDHQPEPPTSPTAAILPAVFNAALPFPEPPTQPNLVYGMVHTASGGILPGAIIEILDEANTTVRAMKTNALGQFYISTPLKNGTYRIETEHADHHFPIFGFTTTGTILEPIDIKATS